MAHKDKTAREFRVYLRPETIQQAKTLALLLNRSDWNMVVDDMIRVGVAYTNDAARLELAEWKNTLKLFDLKSDMKLQVLKGDLPGVVEETYR